MIDRDHDLPIIKQARALGISRGSVYYRPRPVSAAALAVMRRTDELHLELPFAGGRMPRDLPNKEGVEIGRRHGATLMRRTGIEAPHRKPNTSKPAPGHKIYPYLLRDLAVTQMRSNLSAIINESQTAGARVLLVGVRLPPNYGEVYTGAFEAAYRELAKTHRVALVPFILEDFAGNPEYFQADRLHPNEQAQQLMLDRVWAGLKPLLTR